MTRDAETCERRVRRTGVAYGVAAYGAWGLVPIYFKAVAHIPALEIVAHRVIWSVILLGALIALLGRRRALVQAVTTRRTFVALLGSTALIATNWYVFIWAVAHDQLLHASLGYFINPLVSVLLGMVFLRERLRPAQWFSVVLAAVGVGIRAADASGLPWVALVLASTFGFYGLVRKVVRVDAITGLTVEVSLLCPLGLAYVIHTQSMGTGSFAAGSVADSLLLSAAGVVTAVPLLLFTAAARRLRLATVGFLQYLAPSGQFVLAVAVYGEALTRGDLLCFVCIWVALGVYSVDTVRAQRPMPAVLPPAPRPVR